MNGLNIQVEKKIEEAVRYYADSMARFSDIPLPLVDNLLYNFAMEKAESRLPSDREEILKRPQAWLGRMLEPQIATTVLKKYEHTSLLAGCLDIPLLNLKVFPACQIQIPDNINMVSYDKACENLERYGLRMPTIEELEVIYFWREHFRQINNGEAFMQYYDSYYWSSTIDRESGPNINYILFRHDKDRATRGESDTAKDINFAIGVMDM
ncbi:MAG: hypothetical protein KBS89_07530 [Bacteroidales bacterium]|nr:hypothetical protein [Candidatus Egerieousia equi]